MYSGEKLNSITHWVGAALALIGFGALRTLRIRQHNVCFIIRSMIFGVTLILLYTTPNQEFFHL